MDPIKNRLIAARALIDAPEKWTKGTDARDASGFPCRTKEPVAACFCAVGALDRVGLGSVSVLFHELGVPGVPNHHGSLVIINDRFETTHADILALFDSAITLCDAPRKNLLNPDYFIHE